MRTRIIKLLCIVGLAAVALIAARYALADFYYDRAKADYNSLNLSELVYSHELNYILANVDRSLDLRRNSANPLDFKANLLYQSWLLSPDGQYLHQSTLLQSAVDLHLEALGLRNNWAFSTARLALIYSHQAKLDDNFERWFSESHRLGLYETIIARSLMLVGLQKWEKLSVSQQKLTMDFVAASIEQKANSAKAMSLHLDRYGKRQEVCRSLPRTPRMMSVCEMPDSRL